MKTQTFVIAALFASVSAIRLTKNKEGNWNPRPCEMGASPKDVGSEGCIATPPYPAPARPRPATDPMETAAKADKLDSPDGNS